MTAEIKKLFADYEKAFKAFNPKAITKFYDHKFIGADPNGVRVFKNNLLFRLAAGRSAKLYKSLGMNSVKSSLTETPISKQYTLVKVHYSVKFKKTGDKAIEFDLSYLVSKIGKKPRIILYISHEDEWKTMKKLGLTKK